MGVHGTGLEVPIQRQTDRIELRLSPQSRRFQIDKSGWRQGVGGCQQSRLKKHRIKGRVQKYSVHAGSAKLAQRRHTVAAHDLCRAGLQLQLYALELRHQGRVLLHQQNFPGATRSGLETQRTGTGKCVDAAPARQVLAKPVKERLAHPVRRRSQAWLVGYGQPAALPLPANDADLVALFRDRRFLLHDHSLTQLRPVASAPRKVYARVVFHPKLHLLEGTMYKRILLAYDGSESGQKALLDCQDLAQWSHSELMLVAVMPLNMDVMGMGVGVYDPQLMEREKLALQAVLDEGMRRLRAAGHAASGEVLAGETVDEITKYARKISADLIVVGHRHLDSWAARWWRGSISKALIEHAPCSVLVAITQ